MASSSSSSGRKRCMRAGVWFRDKHLGTAFLRNSSGFTAEISLYGGQVLSWKNERGEEMLFLSKKAIFKEREMIHGGIPIGFPKALDHETVRDLHAFASKSMWTADTKSTPLQSKVSNDAAFVDLILVPPPHRTFPHNFEMRLNVLLNSAGKLTMTTHVRNLNTNGKPFSFTFAYHNYLSISDIRDVRVEDLQTMYYLDYLQNKRLCTEEDTSVTFESEVDRLYLSTLDRVTLFDYRKSRSIIIRKNRGLPDVVVWNPWKEKAKTIANFAKDEFYDMLCVGPATVENPIVLEPGQEWTGRQELTALNWWFIIGCCTIFYPYFCFI